MVNLCVLKFYSHVFLKQLDTVDKTPPESTSVVFMGFSFVPPEPP